MYDIIIVGAGPAGLFAADRLIKENLEVLVIDERAYAGGSAINDGKLNLTHRIGMYFDELRISKTRAKELISSIDETLLGYGADKTVYGENTVEIKKWVKKAAFHRVKLIPARQRHLGTDNARRIWKEFCDNLRDRGVTFVFRTRANDIEKKGGGFSVICEDRAYKSRFLVVAPGRGGSYWFRQQARRLGVKTKYGPIDIGIRVEIPYEVYEPITSVLYDPKFVYKTKCHRDITRTFCTNPRGFVRLEPRENAITYNGKEALPVNGHAYKKKKSRNTNFAILHIIELTEPDEDTTELGREGVIACYIRGGGKPLVQRYGDLELGRRSKVSTFFDQGYGKLKPTLAVPEKATPGDISLAYNGRTMDNLKEYLIVLNQILPGITNPETILYAPELKFYDTRYPSSNCLETTVPRLFVIGDGSGKSRGIVGASLTGILAAEGILRV